MDIKDKTKLDLALDKEILFNIYYVMRRIRAVEEKIVEEYPKKQIRCPTHLSIGQEGVPAALAQVVTKHDYAISTHRGHAHYLAKGGDLDKMIAELYGKECGCSKGKGGSMHLIDVEQGFMGTSAIVGNSIPLGVGLALSLELKGLKNISCIFLGDGAIEEGSFYESLNFAVLRKLPTLFICENNLYSVYSPLDVRQPIDRQIHTIAEAVGAKTACCDGNNVIDSYETLNTICQEIRSGSGPWFVEFETYRWREHCGYNYDNDIGYRTEEEYETWKRRDPIKTFVDYLKNNYSIEVVNKLEQIDQNIFKEVEEAFEKAKKASYPDPSHAYTSIYCQ